jgi:hypothetical protein
MKKKYGKKLDLKIDTIDSEEAKPYKFKSSTNVFYQKESVCIDIATDSKKMAAFLSKGCERSDGVTENWGGDE